MTFLWNIVDKYMKMYGILLIKLWYFMEYWWPINDILWNSVYNLNLRQVV